MCFWSQDARALKKHRWEQPTSHNGERMVLTYWPWQSSCQNIFLPALRHILSDQVYPSGEDSHSLQIYQHFICLWCPIPPVPASSHTSDLLKPLSFPTTDCSLPLHPPDVSASSKSFLTSSCVHAGSFLSLFRGWEAFYSTLPLMGSASMLPAAQHPHKLVCSPPSLPR